MQIIGDNWDVIIYETLLAAPPKGETEQERHEFVLHAMLAKISSSLREFLADNIGKIAQIVRSKEEDPVQLYVDRLARYYLHMYDVMHVPPTVVFPRWSDAVEKLRTSIFADGVHRGPRVFFTFQLGYPLLCPLLVAEAYSTLGDVSLSRPIGILIHGQNEPVQRFYRERLPQAHLYIIETGDRATLSKMLDEGYTLIANVDTAYPGTRVEEVVFIGGNLRIPTGLFVLAHRAGALLHCISAVDDNGICVHLSPSIDASTPEKGAWAVSSFFEPLVRSFPLQWMGWGSLN